MRVYGVVIYSVVVIGLFAWANFGEVQFSASIERLYILTPLMLITLFGFHWDKTRELNNRVCELERLVKAQQVSE